MRHLPVRIHTGRLHHVLRLSRTFSYATSYEFHNPYMNQLATSSNCQDRECGPRDDSGSDEIRYGVRGSSLGGGA